MTLPVVPTTSKRAWIVPLTGCMVGWLSLFVAQAVDVFLAGGTVRTSASTLILYVLSGAAWALCLTPVFWTHLTCEKGMRALLRRSLLVGTAAFVLWLAPALLTNPEVSGRWLLYYYAVSMLFGGLTSKFLFPTPDLLSHPARFVRVAEFLDARLHAPFMLAALFLLAVTPFHLMLNQTAPAERSANWAYGFLLLTVGIFFWHIAPFPDFSKRFQRLPAVEAGVLAVAVFAVGYPLAKNVPTDVEQTVQAVDLPNYLANRVGKDDIVISDSSQLRLRTIPNLVPSLDLRPDERGVKLWDDLTYALRGKHRVFWLRAPDGGADSHGILASFLKQNGCLEEIPQTSVPMRVYEMRAPLSRPRVLPPELARNSVDAFDPVEVVWEGIQLTGARFTPEVCSHDTVTVALRWHMVDPSNEPLKVSLGLVDAQGRAIQLQDSVIEDLAQRNTSQWKSDETVAGYYSVTVPLGTPPGVYRLTSSLYRSKSQQRLKVDQATGLSSLGWDTVVLGQVAVYRPENLRADPYDTANDSSLLDAKTEMREGMELNAYGVNTASVIPGEALKVTARWQALRNRLPSYDVRLRIRRGDQVLAEVSGVPVDGTYPTAVWRAGEFVVDRWEIQVPAASPGGKAELEIGVDGGRILHVADVNIATLARSFQVPLSQHSTQAIFNSVGELIGYSLHRTRVSSSEPMILTLYWRALAVPAIDEDYVVFAQVLAPDGRVIAQSDRTPSEGQRPTRSWLSGEIITDRHSIEFSDYDFRGDANLVVGIYNPATMKRVAIQGQADTALLLRTDIHIVDP